MSAPNIESPFPSTFNFPTEMPEQGYVLTQDDFAHDETASSALKFINDRGLEVVSGITVADMDAITEIAKESGTLEFCPNDLASRTGSVAMMQQWQYQYGYGLSGFVFKRNKQPVGYGWVHPEAAPDLPGSLCQFALRLSASEAGQGLGAPTTRVIVAGAVVLHGASDVGLHTWASNGGAVKSYRRTGASLVSTVDGYRPTQYPEGKTEEDSGKRRDTRLGMIFDWTSSQADK